MVATASQASFLGASSDHLIVASTERPATVGETIAFRTG